MYKVLLSNFKKQKINGVIVILFVLISAMMMVCGITISQKSGGFYQEKIKEINGLDHNVYLDINNVDTASDYFIDRISKSPQIDKFYKMTDFLVDGPFGFGVWIHPMIESEEYDLFKPYAIDETIENPIYLSYTLERDWNIKIGDEFEIQVKGEKATAIKTYTVGGFYESLREPYTSSAKLPNEAYDAIVEEFGIKVAKGVAFSLKEGYDYIKFWSECANEVSTFAKSIEIIFEVPIFISFYGNSVQYIVQSVLSFANILSAILIAFSFIIILISICVIWFSITSNIQDDIKKLGIYKSIGYTNTNLRVIMLIQYLILVLIGSILGIIAGILLLPLLTSIIGDTSCLIWNVSVSPLSVVLGLVAPIIIISLVVYLITRKLNKISPVVSMRRGVESHVYKRNNIPLEKYKGDMNIGLSVKSILNGGKRHFSIGFVVAIMAFLCVFVSMLYYNMNVDMRAIISLTDTQPCEVVVEAKKEVFEEIVAMDEVEKYVITNNRTLLASGYEGINIRMTDDFSKTEINNIYQGRYPQNGNEIVLSKAVGERFNKKIGDYFELKENGKSEEYLVVGFSQSMVQSSYIEVNLEGYNRAFEEMNIDYGWGEIFLKDGVDTEAFINKVLEKYTLSDEFFIYNQAENADDMVSPALKDGAKIMSIIMGVITIIAVFMLLLFIIKLKITKEKRNIAINKALGYTNFGIMTQINFGLILIISIGTLLGGILGALLTNSLMEIALSGFGIMKINFAINYWMVFGIIFAIIAVGYLIATLLTFGIKKISPRSLLAD